MSVLVASGMLVNTLPMEDFKLAMDSYADVNGSNIEEVATKLMEAGITDRVDTRVKSDREAMDTRQQQGAKRRLDADAFMQL